MNHDRPRLINNSAQVHILNSIYGVRLAPRRKRLGREVLPIACLNSITLLGAEIVGRAYGGGLLKMEPREADQLPVPSFERVKLVDKRLRNVRPQLAQSLRGGNLKETVTRVDEVVLEDISDSDLKVLRLAREILFQRRRTRGKSGKN